VVRKIPELEALARTKITLINNWEHLPQVILGLTFLHTPEEVEEVLAPTPWKISFEREKER